MYNRVTVVPVDQIIIVDGLALSLTYTAPADMHALQWHDGAGHIEYTDGQANRPLTAADYDVEVAPFTALWQAEYDRLEEERNRPLTPEEKAELIRQQRDALLSATDYMMMPDYPMSELARENLKVYRQALRDVPEQPDFPNSVVWPIKGE